MKRPVHAPTPAKPSVGAADNPVSRRHPRLRRLSEEEIELWLTVAAGVVRRAGSTVPQRVTVPATPPTVSTPRVAMPTSSLAVPPRPTLPPLAPLDRKLRQRLSRGRCTADAAVDLHGYRQDEAFSVLRSFLTRAQGQGAKVVLVVTGKGGRRSADDGWGAGTGVLRRAVPLWLGMPEFRSFVVGFEEAAQSDGGAGALYVRVRRNLSR